MHNCEWSHSRGHPLLRILLGLCADIEPIRRDRPSSRDVSTSLLNALGVLAFICEHPESAQADIGKQIGVSKSIDCLEPLA